MPTISFSQINFPSDNLTLKVLRSVYPTQFDSTTNPTFFAAGIDSGGPNHANDAVGGMLYLERVLALSAFSEAIGDSDPDNHLDEESRNSFAADLVAYYLRYHIAAGPAIADEFIRSIERQAVTQAIAAGGRPPGPAR